MRNSGTGRRQQGSTLIELAVVVAILGVLTAFALPRFLDSLERSRAAEAFNYLAAVHEAQQRHHEREKKFAADLSSLDHLLPPPANFDIAAPTPGASGHFGDSWSLTLTRIGSGGGHGPYKIVFTEQGFDASRSDILDKINPTQR